MGGSRHYHLLARYGVSAEQVEAMIAAQGGACAICGRPDPEHVDHCHETGLVRGVLCFNCNGGLGQFGDDIERLHAAIAYLRRAEARGGLRVEPVQRRRRQEEPPGLFDASG